jgi:hypothetical protein
MTALGAFVDAEQCLREWAMTRTATLVGAGKPLTNGLHLGRVGSPGSGTWGEISRVGGPLEASGAFDQPRMSAQVYGPNRESALAAARALATELAAIQAAPVQTNAGRVAAAFNITIAWAPDNTHPRYLVGFEAWVTT